jgi:hypothetical protein
MTGRTTRLAVGLGVFLALVLATSSGASEGTVAMSSSGGISGSSRSISFGTTTIDGKQWQRLAFRPEIPLGKLAIALDIELFMDDEGSISSRGWKFGNGEEIAETIYRKIYYIRYGQPGETVYARVGALESVTLGYGFLMSGYRNTLDYPGTKNLGMRFELNNVAGISVQSMTNNFLDINRGGPVVGIRVAKPWGPFEIGATIVYDIDQYGGLGDADNDGYPDAIDRFPDDGEKWADTDGDGIEDKFDTDADGDGKMDAFNPETGKTLTDAEKQSINDALLAAGMKAYVWDDVTDLQKLFSKTNQGRDPFGMVGADAAFKLIDKSSLKLVTYAQAGMSLDDSDGDKAEGWGIAAPGVMLKVGPFEGRVEYRHLRDEFQPEYFNGLYDHTRAVADFDAGTVATKDASLAALDGQNLNGVFGQAGMQFGNFAFAQAQYQYLHRNEAVLGQKKGSQRLGATSGLGEGVLSFIPKLSTVEAFYSKDNIGQYDDAFFDRTVDMMYGYRVGFTLGGGVEVVWTTRWVFEPKGKDRADVESQKQVGLETVVRF